MNTTSSVLHQAVNEVLGLISQVAGTGASTDAFTADAFAWRWARDHYLRKYEGGANESVLTAKCITTFKDVEVRNRQTNRRIRQLSLTGPALFCLDEARKEVSRVLGDFCLDEFSTSCEWGPGATATLVAADATQDQKILEQRISVSRMALPYARTMLEWNSTWFAARSGCHPDGPYSVLPSEFTLVDAERYTTVPKDSRSRRGISIQPTMNLFLQKGIGSMIRRRLKRIGVDLDDQSRNQMLAGLAYRCQLSTIDLASASDSVSYELVRFLIPETWFFHLNRLRCPSLDLDGEIVNLEKFSAMGNGFTFELESLIFWSLIRSVEKRFHLTCIHGIYGDDLIVERTIAKAVISLLTEVGFEVNVDKTFVSGPFFESCGAHYFKGVLVTPPYQKEVIRDTASAVRSANRIFRWALQLGEGLVYDPRVIPMWTVLVVRSFRLHDEMNAKRWANWAERGDGSKEPSPRPYPFIPHWLPDDFGLLWPIPFSSYNGYIRFDRLLFEPAKVLTDGWSLLSTALRRSDSSDTPSLEGKLSTLASYGFVNPRGRSKTTIGRGKTIVRFDACWPCEWPTSMR